MFLKRYGTASLRRTVVDTPMDLEVQQEERASYEVVRCQGHHQRTQSIVAQETSY